MAGAGVGQDGKRVHGQTCVLDGILAADSTMLNGVEDLGRSFAGWRFNADKGYDSDGNYKGIFAIGMIPNIKQKVNTRSRGKEFRAKAARIFDHATYKKHDMIEEISGAEEVEHHQICCRLRKNTKQRRFGLLNAIGWNIEILNRIGALWSQDLQYPTPKTDLRSNPADNIAFL